MQAFQDGASRYPIHRSLHFSAKIDLDAVFDDLALHMGWVAQRPSAESLLLEGPNFLILGSGGRKRHYCTCFFEIWADQPETAASVRTAILDRVAETRITAPMFMLKWQSISAHGELSSVRVEEMANDILLDQAYPEISEGVAPFIARYLASEEAVLVLYGPPGTGKTRLIRAVLGEMSRRKGEYATVIYTGDHKTMQSDEIFIKFITGSDDAFVVEDADYLLMPRTDGNMDLHRFLTVADGVARAQGRKIIFSTNLPNLRDMDDALIRPGRCFARVHARNLTREEARQVVRELCHRESKDPNLADERLDRSGNKSHSLAEVYKAVMSAEIAAVTIN